MSDGVIVRPSRKCYLRPLRKHYFWTRGDQIFCADNRASVERVFGVAPEELTPLDTADLLQLLNSDGCVYQMVERGTGDIYRVRVSVERVHQGNMRRLGLGEILSEELRILHRQAE